MSHEGDGEGDDSKNFPVDVALRREIDSALIESIPSEVLPPDRRGVVVDRVAQIVQAEMYAGPLPHPRHLREYNEILPGSADRIISLAEKEQSHRHLREVKIIDAQVTHGKRGQHYGLLVMLVTLGCALLSAYFKETVVAVAFLTASVISVVIAFIKGELNLFPQSPRSDDDAGEDGDDIDDVVEDGDSGPK